MLKIFTIVAFVVAAGEAVAYMVTGDGHWLATSLLTDVVGGLGYLNLRLRRALDDEPGDDDEYDGDVYATDAEFRLPAGAVDAMGTDELVATMRAFDRNPMARWHGTQARARERVYDMPARQRRAWCEVVKQLHEAADTDNEVLPW